MANEANQDNKVEVKATETHTAAPAGKPMTNEDYFAIAALVLGILGLCTFLFPICGGLFSVIALILGYLGRTAPQQAKLAKAGMILGGIALVLAVGYFIFSVVVGTASVLTDYSY